MKIKKIKSLFSDGKPFVELEQPFTLDDFDVKIVKPGEEAGQGVGYLDDGTMIVIESGRDHIGRTVNITVTSVLQTSAGRMVFGRYEATK